MKREHKTHFPQIGEVEKMGALLPLSHFIKFFYNACYAQLLLEWADGEKGKKEKGDILVFLLLLASLFAFSLWALLHLLETKSSKHKLVMVLVYKHKLKLDLQTK